MPQTQSPSIRQWTPESNTEPVVKIGVVVAEDKADPVEVQLPADIKYTISGETGVVVENVCNASMRVDHQGEEVSIKWAGKALGGYKLIRLDPVEAVPMKPGAGITVRGVVAGRGFHWQKHVDQTYAGSLILTAAPGGIVVVNELPLEDYLVGVITAEMSGACPVEFLKAQCVVARSWLLAMTEAKHDDDPFDRCNDDCCQRYQGTDDLSQAAIDAVSGTRGQVLMAPDGKVLDANYYKSCGGVTELAEYVWGDPKPGIDCIVDAPEGDPVHKFMPVTEENLDAYLDGDWLKDTKAYCSTHVVSLDIIRKYLGRVDEVDDYFRWTVQYTRSELESVLRDKLPAASSLKELCDIVVLSRGLSGRASRLRLDWLDESGNSQSHELTSEYAIREVMHRGFLYSSAFRVRIDRDNAGAIKSITLRGAGWGHGAGLCQIGALGMALTGKSVDEICAHYYPKTDLQVLYL